MRSTRKNALLVAGALASGSLMAAGATPAVAQSFGAGYPVAGPGPMPAAAPVGNGMAPAAPADGTYSPYAPRPMASASPYAPRPMAPAAPYAPGPAGVNSPYAARPGVPLDPATMPASASTVPMAPMSTAPPASSPPLPATSPPRWGETAAAAPVKKPSAMKRFFSFIYHGGSDPDTEGRPVYRDPATGRTDLPNARPWLKGAPN